MQIRNNVLRNTTLSVEARAEVMTNEIITGQKRKHLLPHIPSPPWERIRDYHLNRYRQLIVHPLFCAVFDATGNIKKD